ncbi:hypothetical protein [Dysgonomonas sp. 25]|uniref:hypothetical protein n=1 Tax=Dysgonomonas sp. 25 TaxID=2302933 RepID=UPI0013D44F26|nr:hypothetical protein [Dysgonomonas sp. 25]NDV68934.1 hypothetical protein [Dysgonomonas sp. 25]
MEQLKVKLSLPMKLAEIAQFTISNDNGYATVYGNLAPREEEITNADFYCIAYFVEVDGSYSIFQTLDDATNFIWQIRSENGYNEE